MNKEVLKNLMTLKLKTIDTIIDSLGEGSNNTIRKAYDELIDVVNEATEDYIKEKNSEPKKDKRNKEVKKIQIE